MNNFDNFLNNNDDSPTVVKKIKIKKKIYPQVYSYILPKEQKTFGAQKIGYTERKDVDKRIYEQTHTAAFQVKPQKQWSAPAFFSDNKTHFLDTDFHRYLIKVV